jgi:hypothetical protein
MQSGLRRDNIARTLLASPHVDRKIGIARLNRYTQLVLWIVLAPIFGAIQTLASFSLIMLSVRDLSSHDLGRVLLGLTFIYGGGWFLPALVVADLGMLRRILSSSELGRYVSVIAITALVIGLLMPGMMVMLGYPLTALAILLCGFLHRKRHATEASRATVTPPQNPAPQA